VDKEKGDAALLAHSYVTGMVDAATFANWSVFVGMQTGMCALFSFLLFAFSSALFCCSCRFVAGGVFTF